jgi:hypothetical protein
MPDFVKCLRDFKENAIALDQSLTDFSREEAQNVRSISISTKNRLLIGD